MSRIVVGVDGSEHAIKALEWALDEARIRNAEVDVIHAYQYHPDLSELAVLSGEEELSTKADELLRKSIEPLTATRPGIKVPALAVAGPGPESLIEAAAGADLLVVGSRGRGGFKGLLLGSVSQQCVHHAPCPVVVVPATL